MATLVMTSIGTALGGSIGGVLGSLVGRSIDQGLFGPGQRRGPRLGDLTVQTSSYGSPIPQLYGLMRVAGTVVWATDLIEREALEGGGKGSPEQVTYSYAANFAVALSSRPIVGVRRIWADGKLIRGAAGDFKVKTKFRLATGGEDQDPDTLISSVEGADLAPAYRGIALAIFEDLELADFGNRIPLLTFEVVADDAPVPLGELLAEASQGVIDCSEAAPVAGFAAHGTSIGDGLAQLIELSGVKLVDRSGRLRSPLDDAALPIDDQELGCKADQPGGARIQRRRAPHTGLPTLLTVTYYDPNRDYQAGQARASVGQGGIREMHMELPAALTASDARQLAEQALARRWLAADTLLVKLPPSRMSLRPGDQMRIPGTARSWRARSVTVDGMAVSIEAEAMPVSLQALPADGGRPVLEPDLPVGRTQLALLELPPATDEIGDRPIVYAAASNDGRWKSVLIEVSLSEHILPGLMIGRRSIMGQAESVLTAGTTYVVDGQSQVIVRLTNSGDVLFNADVQALSSGANLALIGEELIQFGRAEDLGHGRFRLSRLLRGRRGTEWAASSHAAGEMFCMIDPVALRPVPLGGSAVGAMLIASAHGIGDAEPLPRSSRLISGEAMRPPAPCHFEAKLSGEGVFAHWVRRSHRHWAWVDGVGDGADGFPERYRLTIDGPNGTAVFETSEQSIQIDAFDIPGKSGQSVSLSLVTIGPAALSRAASTNLIL